MGLFDPSSPINIGSKKKNTLGIKGIPVIGISILIGANIRLTLGSRLNLVTSLSKSIEDILCIIDKIVVRDKIKAA